jgi:hypothetical protein
MKQRGEKNSPCPFPEFISNQIISKFKHPSNPTSTGPGVTWGSGHHRNISSSSQLKASHRVRCFHFTSPRSKLQPFKVTSQMAGSSPLLHPFGEFVRERFVMQPVANTHVLCRPTLPAASRTPSPPSSLSNRAAPPLRHQSYRCRQRY